MSFSLDTSGLLTYAQDLFNGLSPIAVLMGGLALGIGLIGWVIGFLMSIARLRGR